MKVTTKNPATEEQIRSYKLEELPAAQRRIKNSRNAQEKWKKLSLTERAEKIRKIAILLLKNKEKYAKVMTAEMGKPIKEAIAEVEKCSWLCNYYADNCEKFLQDEIVKTEAKKSYIAFQPLGVIFCIMPWNFPFWQVFRFAIPALLVGNTVILRHSRSTLGSAIELESIFKKFLPKNVFQNIICESDVAENMVRYVDGVSFTGSTDVGNKIAMLSAGNLKKFVLELGGSDPFVVLQDADIEHASNGAIAGRFLNTGQSCIAAKRFIVNKKKVKEFTEKMKMKIEQIKYGNPMDIENTIGPLANKNQLERLEKQVNESVAMGAKVLVGGKKEGGTGYFYKPTLITGVKKGMPLYDKEVFGPVLPIIEARNDEEAIEIANDTEYGLGASIWSNNLQKAEKYAKTINSGFVSVNQIVKSDPRLPFGGVKKSGIGRELGRYGMLEFCNIKTIVITEAK